MDHRRATFLLDNWSSGDEEDTQEEETEEEETDEEAKEPQKESQDGESDKGWERESDSGYGNEAGARDEAAQEESAECCVAVATSDHYQASNGPCAPPSAGTGTPSDAGVTEASPSEAQHGGRAAGGNGGADEANITQVTPAAQSGHQEVRQRHYGKEENFNENMEREFEAFVATLGDSINFEDMHCGYRKSGETKQNVEDSSLRREETETNLVLGNENVEGYEDKWNNVINGKLSPPPGCGFQETMKDCCQKELSETDEESHQCGQLTAAPELTEVYDTSLQKGENVSNGPSLGDELSKDKRFVDLKKPGTVKEESDVRNCCGNADKINSHERGELEGHYKCGGELRTSELAQVGSREKRHQKNTEEISTNYSNVDSGSDLYSEPVTEEKVDVREIIICLLGQIIDDVVTSDLEDVSELGTRNYPPQPSGSDKGVTSYTAGLSSDAESPTEKADTHEETKDMESEETEAPKDQGLNATKDIKGTLVIGKVGWKGQETHITEEDSDEKVEEVRCEKDSEPVARDIVVVLGEDEGVGNEGEAEVDLIVMGKAKGDMEEEMEEVEGETEEVEEDMEEEIEEVDSLSALLETDWWQEFLHTRWDPMGVPALVYC